MTQDAKRTKDLARIHLAKKELGLDEDTYREMLRNITGQDSAGQLDARGRWKLLQELARLGAKSGAQLHPGKPARPRADKAALIDRIEAHLTDAKRPWAYAHAMAKRMFGVDQVQWCDADQLWRIVAALEYDARRSERKTRG